MDVVDGMRSFRAVVNAGSFAGGARSLGITTAWISKRVAQLESHLGAQLLVRTTRRVSITDAGRTYLERCARLLDDLEEAERAVRDLQGAPKGRLHVTAPMSFGLRRIAPLLAGFGERYPDVDVDLQLEDRYLDVVEEGIDVAVRVGTALEDSSLVARKIGSGARVVCASPAYLRARGTPRHPRDLVRHECLRFAMHASPDRWSFVGKDGPVTVKIHGRLQVNNSIALALAAVEGAGVLLAPDFVVEEALASGRLARILAHHTPSGYGVFAVSPPTRFSTPKVKAFVEHVATSLGAEAPKPSRSSARRS